MTKISEYQADELSAIEGESVMIAAASFESRTAKDGKEYTRTIITLDDGSMYRSASAVIADTLARIPTEAYPVGPVTFQREKSSTKGFQDFWTVTDADGSGDDT